MGDESNLAGLPAAWVAKTLDVCAYGDGVCDTAHGNGVNAAHLSYPSDQNVQNLGAEWIVKQLS